MQNDTLCGKDAKDGLHIFSKLKDGIFLKERKYMLLTNLDNPKHLNINEIFGYYEFL